MPCKKKLKSEDVDMARPSPWVSQFKPGHDNPGVKAIIDYLSEWFEAIDDGTAEEHQPDPYYVRSHGRPPWTEAEIDRLMAAIDEEYQKEVDRITSFPFAEAHTGFVRLAYPQRLALAQGLDAILAAHADNLRAFQRETSQAGNVSVNGHYAGIYRNNYTGQYVVVVPGLPETDHATIEEAKEAARIALEQLPSPQPPSYPYPDPYCYYE